MTLTKVLSIGVISVLLVLGGVVLYSNRAEAASSGPTPSSGINGQFQINCDGAVDCDWANLFNTAGNFVATAEWPSGITDVNLNDYGLGTTDGTYHILFQAVTPPCETSYAACVLLPTTTRDGTYVLSGHGGGGVTYYQSTFILFGNW